MAETAMHIAMTYSTIDHKIQPNIMEQCTAFNKLLKKK